VRKFQTKDPTEHHTSKNNLGRLYSLAMSKILLEGKTLMGTCQMSNDQARTNFDSDLKLKIKMQNQYLFNLY
jgi:hypothetical protein